MAGASPRSARAGGRGARSSRARRPRRSRSMEGGDVTRRNAVDLVLEDLRGSRGNGWRSVLVSALTALATVRGQATLLFRLSHALGHVWAPLGHLLKQVNHFITGADLAWQARIGGGLV